MRQVDALLSDVERFEIEEIEQEIGRKLTTKEILNRIGQPSRNESCVRDVLYIKQVERELGRTLTDTEMNGERFFAELPSGGHRSYRVPVLSMPWDLIRQVDDTRVTAEHRPKNKLRVRFEDDVVVPLIRHAKEVSIWDNVNENVQSQDAD